MDQDISQKMTYKDIYGQIEQFRKTYPTLHQRNSEEAQKKWARIHQDLLRFPMEDTTQYLVSAYLNVKLHAARKQYTSAVIQFAGAVFSQLEQADNNQQKDQIKDMLGNTVTIKEMIHTTKKYWLQDNTSEAIKELQDDDTNLTDKIIKHLKHPDEITIVIDFIETHYHLKRHKTAHDPAAFTPRLENETIAALVRFLDAIRTNTNLPPQKNNLFNMVELYTRLGARDQACQCLITLRGIKPRRRRRLDTRNRGNTQPTINQKVLKTTHIKIADGLGSCPHNISLCELLFFAQAALGNGNTTLANYTGSMDVQQIDKQIRNNRKKGIKILHVPLAKNVTITAQYCHHQLLVDLCLLEKNNGRAFNRLLKYLKNWSTLKRTASIGMRIELASSTKLCKMLNQNKHDLIKTLEQHKHKPQQFDLPNYGSDKKSSVNLQKQT